MNAYLPTDTWLDAALTFTREHPGQPIADDAEDRNRKAAVLWLNWKAEHDLSQSTPIYRVEVRRRRRTNWPELAFFGLLAVGAIVFAARLGS